MKYFSLILLSFIILSCKKEANVTISINAVHRETKEVFQGLSFSIIQEDLSDNSKKNVYTGTFDHNGSANIIFKAKKNFSYEIVLDDPATFDLCNDTEHVYFRWDNENFEHTFEIVPCAFLKLDVLNVDCSTSYDGIQVWAIYQSENDPWFNSEYPSTLYGYAQNCADNISNYVRVRQGTYVIKQNIMKTNPWVLKYDTIYLQTNEYRNHVVTY
jgi:hypothetical protein